MLWRWGKKLWSRWRESSVWVSRRIRTFGIIGVAAGSLFVFKGKYRAVLINKMARHVLELSDEQLNGLIAREKLEEIESDDEEISK